jgi:regulator of extracellular matrix RemA (YlzA/DUF370 family)
VSQHPDKSDVAAATRALAQLNRQADEVRADILRSRRELAKVQHDYGDARAAQLLEANEHLVVAALQAETIAETATSHLDELARTSQRDALTETPNRALMLDRLVCFSISTSSSTSMTRSAIWSVMKCCA